MRILEKNIQIALVIFLIINSAFLSSYANEPIEQQNRILTPSDPCDENDYADICLEIKTYIGNNAHNGDFIVIDPVTHNQRRLKLLNIGGRFDLVCFNDRSSVKAFRGIFKDIDTQEEVDVDFDIDAQNHVINTWVVMTGEQGFVQYSETPDSEGCIQRTVNWIEPTTGIQKNLLMERQLNFQEE